MKSILTTRQTIPPPITLCYLRSHDGTRLKPDDAIMNIPDLEDGDTIDVFTEQQGGEDGTSDGLQ